MARAAAPHAIPAGQSIVATLTTRDQFGNVFVSPSALSVAFNVFGGTSTGTFSSVIDHGDGTYSSTFTAASSGTPIQIGAAVAGQPLPVANAPTLTVGAAVPGSFSITSATPAAAGAVTLVWTASSSAATYTVTYGTTTGLYPSTASVSATSPYTVTGLSDTTNYFFMITAVDASGSTNATAEASARSDATAPTTPAVPTWAASYGTVTTAAPALSWLASTDAGFRDRWLSSLRSVPLLELPT